MNDGAPSDACLAIKKQKHKHLITNLANADSVDHKHTLKYIESSEQKG